MRTVMLNRVAMLTEEGRRRGMQKIRIGVGAVLGALLMYSSAIAVDIRIQPDAAEVFPGQDLAVNVVVENVPDTGLGVVQFRLDVSTPGGLIAGAENLEAADEIYITAAAPLNTSLAGNGYSGLGNFILDQAGTDGVLVMDNPPFLNGSSPADPTSVSALFSFAHTATANFSGGSGVVARFLLHVGTATTAQQLQFALSDVVLMDGEFETGLQEYAIDNISGGSVSLGCRAQVPDLVGLSLAAAQESLQSANLVVERLYELDNSTGNYPLGQVLQQSIAAATGVACGGGVELAINTAPAEVENALVADLENDQDGGVVLSWTPSISVDVASYEIYQGDVLLTSVPGATANGCQMSALQNNVNNQLKVVAVDTFGNKSSGVILSAIPVDDVPPALMINPIPSLTNQAELVLGGSIEQGGEILIFNATSLAYPGVSLSASGEWQAVVPLLEGENILQFTAEDFSGNSVTSSDYVVMLDTLPPALTQNEVTTPTSVDMQTIGGSVEKGATVSVSVNTGATVGSVSYSAGSWSCTLSNLAESANDIFVTAVDAAGNQTTLTPLTIVYNPVATFSLDVQQEQLVANDSQVVAVSLSLVDPGDEVTLEQIADIDNDGLRDAGEPVIRRLLLRDEDNDSQISAQLNMLSLLAEDHASGSYVIRASDGVNEVMKRFTVYPVNRDQSLGGRVTDGTDPVAGALVQLQDKWRRTVAWAVADLDGHYFFQVKEPGEYYVVPRSAGYSVNRNELGLMTVAVNEAAVAADLVMVPGEFVLSGQVLGAAEGLAGVRVTATGVNDNGYFAQTLTATDGTYSISLPGGDYLVQVGADCFSGPTSLGLLTGSSVDINVILDANSAGNDFNLPGANTTISGFVVDENSMPVAGVEVRACLEDDVIAATVSAVDGSYLLPLTSNSSYTIAADPASANSLGLVGQSIAIETMEASVSDRNLLVHSVSSSIDGRVDDQTGQAVSNLPVALRSDDGLYAVKMKTAEDGSYHFRVFPATWWVRAETEQQGFLPADEVTSELQPDVINFTAELNSAPDLVVTSSSVPATAAAGNTIPLSAVINNQGGIDVTTPFSVGFILSVDQNYDASDSLLLSSSLAELAAGDAQSVTVDWTIPVNSVEGTYYVLIVADFGNTVSAETAKENNVLVSSSLYLTAASQTNNAPVLDEPLRDQVAVEGEAFEMVVASSTFSDSDGNSLTLSSQLGDGSDLPDWLSFDAASGAFSGTPGATNIGLFEIEVTATDPGGLSVSDQFVINVIAVSSPSIILGTDGNDTLIGTSENDVIIGGSGIDTLSGGAGDDRFIVEGTDSSYDKFDGGAGNDRIEGGDGDDTIRIHNFAPEDSVEVIDGGGGNNIITGGTASYDTLDFSATTLLNIASIDGGSYNDTIIGSAGNDVIIGGSGIDTLSGGAGDDRFIVEGTDSSYDKFDGGAGNDRIEGGDGDDTIRIHNFAPEDSVEVIDGGGGNNIITGGTASYDTLDFSATTLLNIASIDGGSYNDTIIGSAGNDVIIGGSGIDTLSGGAGDDRFIVEGTDSSYDKFDGGAGNDRIEGGDGDDTIRIHNFAPEDSVEVIDGGGGNNIITGGTASYDTLDFSATTLLNIASIDGGSYNDTIIGSAGNDVIIGGSGIDTLSGGAGDDRFIVEGTDSSYDKFNGGAGNDRIEGGDGDDTIRIHNFAPEDSVEVIDGGGGNNIITGGTASYDTLDFSATTLLNIASIDGGSYNDTIIGSAGNDVIIGGSGIDTLSGGAGDDRFIVEGTDSSYDKFDGGAGNDRIEGGDGDDTIRIHNFAPEDSVEVIDGGGGNNIITGGTASYDTLDFSATTLLNIASIDGGSYNDTIIGSAGNDVIIGGSGIDTLSGGAGDDRFIVEGTDSSYDKFDGGAGNDRIEGGDGDDTIRIHNFAPEDSVEVIDGGGGNNIITGGTASYDTLDFSATTLLNIASIDGGSYNDTIIGSAGNDVIIGGSGIDTLSGGSGDDVYLFATGFGTDTIDNSSNDANQSDAIEFGAGILPADVLVSRGVSGNSDDLILKISGTNDQITVKTYFMDNGTSSSAVDEIRFADGTVWTVATITGM